jgi:hypothetical protein
MQMRVIRSRKRNSGFFCNASQFFPLEEDEQPAHCVSANLISLLATKDSTSRGNERKFNHEQFKRNSSQANEAEDFAASFPQTSERNPCICVSLRGGGGDSVDDQRGLDTVSL